MLARARRLGRGWDAPPRKRDHQSGERVVGSARSVVVRSLARPSMYLHCHLGNGFRSWTRSYEISLNRGASRILFRVSTKPERSNRSRASTIFQRNNFAFSFLFFFFFCSRFFSYSIFDSVLELRNLAAARYFDDLGRRLTPRKMLSTRYYETRSTLNSPLETRYEEYVYRF